MHLTKWQGCYHFDILHALVELAIVYDKVQPRAVEKWGLANSLSEAIYRDSPSLLLQDNCGSL